MTQKHSDNSDTWTHVFKIPQENMYESTEMYRDYRYDAAHPKHCLIYWTICSKQYYQYHRADFSSGYAYSQRTTCGNIQWQICENTECHWHFAKKKKKNAEFPGYGRYWHDMFFLQFKWDFETKKCHMIKWYTCLHDKCKKYMKQKQNNGFFPQSGKNKSFMLKNNMEKKL